MDSIEKQGMTFEDALGYLAVCQAEYDRLGRIVSTKDPDSLRHACDEEMRLRYELQSVKSVDVRVGDTVVATYSVVKTKEQPSRENRWFSIGKTRALEWLMQEAPRECMDALLSAARKIAEEHMLSTGELIDGATTGVSTEPAVPSRFKNTMLKVYKDKVAELGSAEVKGVLQ